MENFVVSARKYRPGDFDEVVGQESITRTLQNAIKNNHLAQAFLFCGPRGVGKTTCARILAKVINRETADSPDQDDYSFNIFELDAASNNSVDDIRSLNEQVRIPPQVGNYRVFIIDEAHMLSAAAFNAFLKTLEEPPKHAIFILATTEKHKILPTILSRCQIFDFKRIEIDDIVSHLMRIAEKEKVKADPDGLHIIAEKADGALRDALSIFDQIVSFSGDNISYKDVIENLSILDYDYYFRAVDILTAADVHQALLLFNEILNEGFDGHQFINGLASHLRNLLVCKDERTLKLLEVGANVREKYREQAQSVSDFFLFKALEELSKTDVQYKTAKNNRLLVELCLLKIAQLEAGEKKNFSSEVSPSAASDQATQKQNPELTLPKTAKPKEATIKNEVSNNPADAKTEAAVTASRESETPKVEEPKEEVKPAETAKVEQAPTVSSEGKNSPKNAFEKLKGKGLPGSFSIKQSLKTAEEERLRKQEAEAGPVPNEAFEEQKMQQLWVQFGKRLEKGGQDMVGKILQQLKPAKTGENTLELEVVSKLQESQIKSVQGDLMTFLRDELRNGLIELKFVINQEESEKKHYTSKDIYQKMVEKNPLLNELKNKLDLELE